MTEETESTRRQEERTQENEDFTSVIIKRSDFVVRHPDDILETAIREGNHQYLRSPLALFLSSVAAGLILGFAAMSVAFATELAVEFGLTDFSKRFLVALFYPLGFIICIISGTQLFTEQTATAVYPILEKKHPVSLVFRIWGIVVIGNLLGTFCSSVLVTLGADVTGLGKSFSSIAHHISHFTSAEIFVSAILAGWLMAQGGWLILATSSSSAQIICIYIVTFIIGIGGFHHSIVGSAELFSAYLVDADILLSEVFRVLLLAILGNLIGGIVFVGILNYAHIRKA